MQGRFSHAYLIMCMITLSRFYGKNLTSEIHKIYETTSKVLQKLDEDSLAAKIVKTISLIYIVEQFEKLPPIKGIIIDTYRDCVSDVQIIDDVLTELVEKECLIYLKRSNGYLKIKESSGVDIGAEIQNVIERLSRLECKRYPK